MVLVTLVTGNMAFARATKTDNLYKCFYYGKAHVYWKSRCKALATVKVYLDEEFINLAT